MKRVFFFAYIMLSICGIQSASGNCPPPNNPTLYINYFEGYGFVDWQAPDVTCVNIMFYEIEYANFPFTPGMGAGTLVSPVYSGPWSLPTSNFSNINVWIRTICNCPGPPCCNFDPGDVESQWVLVSIVDITPPCYTESGSACAIAPTMSLGLSPNCNQGTEVLSYCYYAFSGPTAPNSACLATSTEGYINWRKFIAPPTGSVDISITNSEWNDIGLRLIQSNCNGTVVFCQQSFGSGESFTVEGLSPGAQCFIGVWNNDYPYSQFNISTTNIINICESTVDCAYPTNVAVSSITNFTATVSWNGNGAELWQLEYGPSGFSPGTGTVIGNITESPVILSDLNPSTAYSFYLSAICIEELNSVLIGPSSFTTVASMSIISSPPNTSIYCCSVPPALAESFNVNTFCPPVSFSHSDTIVGADCDFVLYRTITATDGCGNSVSTTFNRTVRDNQIPCGCENEQVFTNPSTGMAVAIDGDWAVVERGATDRIYKFENDEWVVHTDVDLGVGISQNTLSIYGDVIVAKNLVYRLVNDEWLLEATLESSLGDVEATASAAGENTIALLMNNNIFVFEFIEDAWQEVAIFEDQPLSLRIHNNLLLSASDYNNSFGRIYHRINGTWQLEHTLEVVSGYTPTYVGLSSAMDESRITLGESGRVFAYQFDGETWYLAQTLLHPYPQVGSGYPGSAFGRTLDFEGNILAVGDYFNNPQGGLSGAIVIFEWLCDQWVPKRNMVSPHGTQNRRFGGVLALSGAKMVVGPVTFNFNLGFSYNTSNGRHWFYSCMDETIEDFSFELEDVTISCNDEIPAAAPVIGTNWCDYEVDEDLTGEIVCGAVLVRTMTISDSFGNSASATQNIAVVDNLAPVVVSAPANILISCAEDWSTEQPVFNDNCALEVEVIFSEQEVGDDCDKIITQTWLALDECGNSTEVVRTIEITDSEGPEFECPDNIIHMLQNDDSLFVMPNLIADLFAIDNCSVNISTSQSIASNQTLGVGTYDVEVSATDECGNTSICNVSVIVDFATGNSSMAKPEIVIFPNPTNGQLNILLNENTPVLVELFGMHGQRLLLENYATSGFSLNLSHLAKGMYSIRLTTSKQTVTEKVILK